VPEIAHEVKQYFFRVFFVSEVEDKLESGNLILQFFFLVPFALGDLMGTLNLLRWARI